jgi:hypothetical protein
MCDPIVLSHASALLKSTPGGVCQYIQADLRDPRKILDAAAKTLDFGQPVAIMILMTLQYVPDADNPHQIVRTVVDAVPPGSYLAISDVAMDLAADANVAASADKLNEQMKTTRQTIRGLVAARGSAQCLTGWLSSAPGSAGSAWRSRSSRRASRTSSWWTGPVTSAGLGAITAIRA